MMHFGLARGH